MTRSIQIQKEYEIAQTTKMRCKSFFLVELKD